jgi:glycosyltransferase involved in cell wall biosynthesis
MRGMSSASPVISVLMPVYNAERYLTEATDSILKQTYTDFELIIINDGSTDRSLEILEGFARQDSRIRLISRENRGLVATLNEGLSLAKAPLIARMDADDIAFPDRFYIQKNYLDNNPGVLLLGTRVLIIDEDGDAICDMVSHFSHDDIVNGLLSRQGQLVYHPSVMFRKKEVLAIGGYRNKYPHVEDLDLFLRLAETGNIENLSTILLKYREHLQKIGHLYNSEQEKQIDLLLKEAHKSRNLPYRKPSDTVNRENISSLERLKTWAWLALKAKNNVTAKKYAIKCLKKSPFSTEIWRLVACVLRGY